MKILNISSMDLTGSRFNGLSLSAYMKKHGHEVEHCVWEKESDDINSWQFFNKGPRKKLKDLFCKIEDIFSIQSLLYPFPLQLLFDKRFYSADIVHYHLIHTGYFSLLALPVLSRIRPSVWTIHDPWAFTGHCVHPYDCDKWKSGCGNCPYPDTHFKIRKDRTALNWKIKKMIYKAVKAELIVASSWIHGMIKESPLLGGFNVHEIPFGVDTDIFKPLDAREIRSKLDIADNEIAIGFRATAHEYKGLEYIRQSLEKLDTDRKVCLLTTNDKGLIIELKDKYKIIEAGWVAGDRNFAELYNAIDLFLMPSTAETFGMMAVEAMLCGKPVICFEGTALPDITGAPESGTAVPYKDSSVLAASLKELIENDELRAGLGNKALEYARERYSLEQYAGATLELYESLLGKE